MNPITLVAALALILPGAFIFEFISPPVGVALTRKSTVFSVRWSTSTGPP